VSNLELLVGAPSAMDRPGITRARYAIVAGLVAGSIALVGFGLDSAIEGFAGVVIVWRFTGHRVFSHAAEQCAHKLVAIQFFVLAPYVAPKSTGALLGGERADVSWVGIGRLADRAARQRAGRRMVARPRGGHADRRRCDQRGGRGMARRRQLRRLSA
jgi:hypothetical protein